jgi:hypothetical protein
MPVALQTLTPFSFLLLSVFLSVAAKLQQPQPGPPMAAGEAEDGGAAAAPLAGARARPGLSSPPSSGLADGALLSHARRGEKDPASGGSFLPSRLRGAPMAVLLWPEPSPRGGG